MKLNAHLRLARKIVLTLLLLATVNPASAKSTEKEKTIVCDDKRSRPIRVARGRITTVNFPFKPKDVVPGASIFDFKQIKNDLLISALRPSGHTNVVVYLENRRCAFDLLTVANHGDDILIVKDPKESQFEVKPQ